MEIDTADLAMFNALAGEAELAQAMAIARNLNRIGVERDKALRIALVAARHRVHDGRAPRLDADETLEWEQV